LYYPSLDEVRHLTAQGKRVPIYREILADMETPVSAYRKVARGDYSFLLESVVGGERLARYSFIGAEPYRVLTLAEGQARITGAGRDEKRPLSDPLHLLRWELEEYATESVAGLPRFNGGAVGYLGYEVSRYFEPTKLTETDSLGLPEAVLMFTDTLLVFDHLEHKIQVVSHVWPYGDVSSSYAVAVAKIDGLVERLTSRELHESYSADRKPPEALVKSNIARPEFLDRVRDAKRYVEEGDLIQVVLSQRFSRPLQTEPFNAYRALRTVLPAPYMYYLSLGEVQVVGASPQVLVRVEDGLVTTHPIAGSRPRGKYQQADDALADELRQDERERAAHMLLLDLARNDVGRASVTGSVRVTRLLEVERYAHEMHLVSQVTGCLRPGLTQYDALRACFPSGAITGAPKARAMEIIAELEPDRRGPFAGAVGYFDYAGNLDTALTQRTIVVKDGIAHVQAGAVVSASTEPERAYEGTLAETAGLLRALEAAERI
jgi:anthranilate synthase component 1